MQPTGVIFLKVLLNKYALGGKETLLKLLPKADAEALSKVTTTSQDIAASLSWSHEIFSRIHYSWVVPLIKNLPESLQKVTIASLPGASSAKLKRLLGISSSAKINSEKLKLFWLNKLYSQWKPVEAIPLQYLEETQLSPLLSLSKDKLVELIDLLALNDLAESIRHIVDKNTLTAVYSSLSHNQQAYLRICLHQKDQLKIPKIDVNKMKNSPEELKKALHKRGMLRLGKALCGQSREFLWHVTHILDTGRGTALQEYYTEQPIPAVTAMLVQQTLAATNFINES